MHNFIYCALLMVPAGAVHADWTVLQATAGNSGCVLETDEITIHDGYQDTRVKLNIDVKRLLVITHSNIDTGFDDIDLQVDGRASIPADAAIDETNLRFSADITTIIEQFRKGNKVRVSLRFWPSYPATQRFEAVFSLTGFTRAWNEARHCND